MDNSEAQPDLDDIIKALPLKEKIPVLALKKLLDSRQIIDEEQQKEILQTKIKYQKLIQPLLQRVNSILFKASQIIRGGTIKLDEVAGAEDCMKAGEKIHDFLKGKVIENYWIGVLSNSALVDEINQEDQNALKYLLDIQKVNDPSDPESIQLEFFFKPNSFFNETKIKRKLHIKNGQALSLEGDCLTWKQGKCLTHALKKVTNKKTGEKTTIEGKKIKSFFDIFLNCDQKNSTMLNKVAENMSEISTLLILDSVDYFLGVINADEESQDEQSEDAEEQGKEQ